MANFLSSIGNVSGFQLISTTTSNAPLLVSNTSLVSNLNVQYLNGQPQSYYTNASNISSGILAVSYGGTGKNYLAQGQIPYGQGNNVIGQSSNLFWNSSSNYLGIGTFNPQNAVDVVGNINGSSNLTIGNNCTISNSLAIGTSNILTFPTLYLGTTTTTTPCLAVSDKGQSTFISIGVSNVLPQICGNKNGMSFGYMSTYSSNQNGYTEYGRFQSNALYLSNLRVQNPIQNAIQFYISSSYSASSSWTPINSSANITLVNSNFSCNLSSNNTSNSITTLYNGYFYLNFIANIFISGLLQNAVYTTSPFTMQVYKNSSNQVYNYSNQFFNGNQTGAAIIKCSSNDFFTMQCSGVNNASASSGTVLTFQSL